MRFVDVKLKCGWPSCTVVGVEGDDVVITRTVAMDGRKPREIDVCKEHSDELDELLAPLFSDGRPAEAVSAARPQRNRSKSSSSPIDPAVEVDLVCRADGCDRGGVPLKNKTGLAQHVIRTHGFADLASYLEQHQPSALQG